MNEREDNNDKCMVRGSVGAHQLVTSDEYVEWSTLLEQQFLK